MWEGGREKVGASLPATLSSGERRRPVGGGKESGLVFPRLSPLQDGSTAAATHPVSDALRLAPLRPAFRTPRVLARRSAGLMGKLTVLLI